MGQAGPLQVYNWTEYGYDDFGRLWKVMARYLDRQNVNLVTRYTYDANGSLDTTTHENAPADASDDVIWDYDYDILNRLEVLKVSRGGVWDETGQWSEALTWSSSPTGGLVGSWGLGWRLVSCRRF